MDAQTARAALLMFSTPTLLQIKAVTEHNFFLVILWCSCINIIWDFFKHALHCENQITCFGLFTPLADQRPSKNNFRSVVDRKRGIYS